jgi:WhiB family redox-sensing transcriptional regulator
VSGAIFGAGPAHQNGTRLFWKSTPEKRIGAGSGTARPGMAIGDVPPVVLERRPAACARPGIDPRWFEPSWGEGADKWHGMDKARAICQGCPVLFECRTWAIGVKGLEGMWGATTPEERKQLRRAS